MLAWVQDDLTVNQLPPLEIRAIIDKGAERLDRRPEIALQNLAHHSPLIGWAIMVLRTRKDKPPYSAACRAIGLFGCCVQLA